MTGWSARDGWLVSERQSINSVARLTAIEGNWIWQLSLGPSERSFKMSPLAKSTGTVDYWINGYITLRKRLTTMVKIFQKKFVFTWRILCQLDSKLWRSSLPGQDSSGIDKMFTRVCGTWSVLWSAVPVLPADLLPVNLYSYLRSLTTKIFHHFVKIKYSNRTASL